MTPRLPALLSGLALLLLALLWPVPAAPLPGRAVAEAARKLFG